MRLCASVIVVVALGATACSSSDGGSSSDKYKQTWTRSYSDTTCSQWLHVMSSQQRFAGAADILTAARNEVDGGTGLPSDALINEFASGLDNVCVVPSMTVTDAAFGLYKTEPTFWP